MTKQLKAPRVDHYLWWLGDIKYHHYDNAVAYDEKSYALLDELFELLKKIKPEKESVWKLWLRADRGTIEDFGDYEEMLDCGEVENYEDFEERWKTEYPDEVEWYEFQAVNNEEINYRAIIVHHRFVIELDGRKPKGGYEHNICEFSQWLLDATKEVVAELEAGTYNDRLQSELPVGHRTGTLLRKYEMEIWPHVKEEIIGDLTEADLQEFIACAEEELTDKSRLLKQMTANDFFRFCAMGYTANNYDGCDKSPKEQYLLHADGRDEGLRDIDPDSPEAYAEWYHHRQRGGHPWEVCRGGNSTHVALYVYDEEDGWSLNIAGSAWTRCREAMKFFLTLYRAGLPVTIRQAPLLKARVRGEEKVGVVPQGVIPAYCHERFPGEDVFDFMNLPYDQLDRDWIAAHCVWQPIAHVELSEG